MEKTCNNCASGQPGFFSCSKIDTITDENGICKFWFRKPCRYLIEEDTTNWHSDVFDHPTYTYYCGKDGLKKEILYSTCKSCELRED